MFGMKANLPKYISSANTKEPTIATTTVLRGLKAEKKTGPLALITTPMI